MHGSLEVVVIRKGRKRKAGIRHPNGDLVTPSQRRRRLNDLELLALQPHRRDMPIIKENGKPDLDLRLSDKAGTALGNLNLMRDKNGKKIINDQQHEAGRLYSVDCGAYFASIGVPTGLGGGGRGYACSGEFNCQDCECRKRKAAYDGPFEALMAAGQKCAKAVAHVAVHDKRMGDSELIPLIRGLDVLVRYYGLTAGANRRSSLNTN